VVTDINRNVAATLKACGPAILAQESFAQRCTTILAAIVTRSHPCQRDLGDDEEDRTDIGEEEVWKIFQKPVMKFASSQTNFERSTAVGVVAECTAHMGAGVTPYTPVLLKLLLHRLSDEDPETKSNAAYAIGLLVYHSTDSAAYLPSYNTILSKLEPLLQTQRARTLDNACGCVSRMIMAHQDKVPVDDIIPVLVDLLPLTEDYEENKPIFECITGLCELCSSCFMTLANKSRPTRDRKHSQSYATTHQDLHRGLG
jgi:hypothetical protein